MPHTQPARFAPEITASDERPVPSLDGARHQYVTVHPGTQRQARLHVVELGDGAPLVLLHGFFQHGLAWRHVLPLLPAGYRALCVDLRGFGSSEQTHWGYDLDTLADDVGALITQLGLGPAVIAGHDLGAQVALRLAVRRPEQCAAVLAVNTQHPFPSRARMAGNLWRMWFTALLEYPVLGPLVIRTRPGIIRMLLRRGARDRSAWSAAELDEFTAATRTSARPTQQVLWQYVVTEMPRMLRSRGAGRLTAPTVLLAGARDGVIPARLAAGDASRARRLETRVVPGCGHQLLVEAPARVAEVLAELAELAGDRAGV